MDKASNLLRRRVVDDVTQILSRIDNGDRKATEELLPLVYEELRSLAAARFRNERSGHTLQATALVHEAFVRLVDDAQSKQWDSRAHFFGAASLAMRRILIEHARARKQQKHGGDISRVQLSGIAESREPRIDDLIDLDDALTRLGDTDPLAAQIVTLRVFGGMSVDEAGEYLNVSARTVKRHWAYARAWLRRAISLGD